MKVYEVILSDYDLYGEYGLFIQREKAEERLTELKAEYAVKLPRWVKHFKIVEKELMIVRR